MIQFDSVSTLRPVPAHSRTQRNTKLVWPLSDAAWKASDDDSFEDYFAEEFQEILQSQKVFDY